MSSSAKLIQRKSSSAKPIQRKLLEEDRLSADENHSSGSEVYSLPMSMSQQEQNSLDTRNTETSSQPYKKWTPIKRPAPLNFLSARTQKKPRKISLLTRTRSWQCITFIFIVHSFSSCSPLASYVSLHNKYPL